MAAVREGWSAPASTQPVRAPKKELDETSLTDGVTSRHCLPLLDVRATKVFEVWLLSTTAHHIEADSGANRSRMPTSPAIACDRSYGNAAAPASADTATTASKTTATASAAALLNGRTSDAPGNVRRLPGPRSRGALPRPRSHP